MAIELYDAGNGDGLFNILGKAFFALDTLNTARGTTVPTEVQDVLAQFNLLTGINLDRERTINRVASGILNWQTSGASLATTLRQFCEEYLVQVVHDDVSLNPKTLTEALKELITQMEGAGGPAAPTNDVDASAVAASAAAVAGNTGDGVVTMSVKRGDGKNQENLFAEVIRATIVNPTAPATAALTLVGNAAVTDELSHLWPTGSGTLSTLSAIDAAASNNLLVNGGFENETDLTDAPDDIIVAVGTVATTLKITDVETQTLVVGGTPTGGGYTISWVNQATKTITTEFLAYNASGSAVQAALRKFAELAAVTVTTTGTSPNYTHTIKFNGVGGNLAQITATSYLTGGTPTLTPATTVTGSAHTYKGGRSVEFDSDGAQLTELRWRLTGLKPKTVYAFNGWFKADVVPAAGVLTIDLYDGGAIINDYMSVANSFTISCPGLTTSYVVRNGFFRTGEAVPAVVYLRIRISTAVSTGTSIFFDHVALAAATEIYPGGPFAAAFSGAVDWADADAYDLTMTNGREGKLQEHFSRAFRMRSLGLLLPSDTGGTETIPDTVVG